MTAAQYAPAVLQAGRDLGITPRGIVIGFATVYVESNWTMYANAAVPESMSIPHEAVGSDGHSVGLFQQQIVDSGNRWWWGDAATCMDPYKSAALFFSRLANLDYNNTANSPGSYAQAVQQSAYPDRYDQRMADAQTLYNQISSGGTATTPVDPNRPDFNEFPNWCDNNEDRQNTTIDLFLLHTQEGSETDDNAALDLSNFCISTTGTDNPVSYHYAVRQASDGGVTVVDMVDTDLACWAVGNSNLRSINLCFAGTDAAWSREQWMTQAKAIDVAAYLCVQDCDKYGINPKVIAPPYSSPPPGISDHRYCTRYLKDGNTHTDVGDNFPWDVFAAAVAKYAGTASPTPDTSPAAAAPDYTVLVYEQMCGPIDPDTGYGIGWPQLAGDPDALAELQQKVDAGTPLYLVDALAAQRWGIKPTPKPTKTTRKATAKRTARKAAR